MYKVPFKNGYVCRNCDLRCAECSGSAENCTQCYHGYVLILNQCVAKCRHEEYLYEDTCLACEAPCHTCLGPGNKNCTSCQRNGLHGMDVRTMYLHERKCLFRCPLEYYEESLTAMCEPCSKNCLKCDGASNRCHVCAQGFFKSYPDEDECIKGCLAGKMSNFASYDSFQWTKPRLLQNAPLSNLDAFLVHPICWIIYRNNVGRNGRKHSCKTECSLISSEVMFRIYRKWLQITKVAFCGYLGHAY